MALFFPSVESIVLRLEENELMTNTNKSNNRSKVEILSSCRRTSWLFTSLVEEFLNFDSHDDTDQIVVVRRYCNSLFI